MGVLRILGLGVIALAGFAGLALSLFVHVNALAGRLPFGDATMSIHLWAIAVAAPAIMIAYGMQREERRMTDWGWLLRGAPVALRVLLLGFFLYAIFNFAKLAFETDGLGPDKRQATTLEAVTTFSASWLVIFTFAVAVAWSAIATSSERRRRCPNGHLVGADDEYCGSCGAKIGQE